jgi:hypothetical protein
VLSDGTIPNNKPNIVIHDNEKEICILIDVAILSDRNVIKKEAENIIKYKDLKIEIQRMWNVKTNDTSNNWGKQKDLKINQKTPEQHVEKGLNQKTGILGTAHILRQVLT